LLKEPFIGRAENEESVAEFVVRRLGREFLDYAVDPFVAGIFAGQAEALSVRAAFPRLYALEEKYGGLVKGTIGGRRERK
jgi:oxygen-dependent protoporphyrinogen oxidase